MLPDRFPGCEGVVFPVTVSVRAGLSPHELLAITLTVPPEPEVVTLIEFVVELPDHPFGRVQI